MSAPTTQAGTVPEDEKPVAWLCIDLAAGRTKSITFSEGLAQDRARYRFYGSPAWEVFPLYDRSTRDTETAALQAELAGAHDRIEGLLSDHAAEKYRADTAEQQLSELRAEMETVRAGVAHFEAEARRYAGFYPEGSDGRNTFVIFADMIAARSTFREGVR